MLRLLDSSECGLIFALLPPCCTIYSNAFTDLSFCGLYDFTVYMTIFFFNGLGTLRYQFRIRIGYVNPKDKKKFEYSKQDKAMDMEGMGNMKYCT